MGKEKKEKEAGKKEREEIKANIDELMLFTDGSLNTRSNIGYGAYLAVSEFGLLLDSLKMRVKVKRFEHTSSTKLELQTLLWALSDIKVLAGKVIVYTDSQNIMGDRKSVV